MNKQVFFEYFVDAFGEQTRIHFYTPFGRPTGVVKVVSGYVVKSMVVNDMLMMVTAGNEHPVLLDGQKVILFIMDINGANVSSRMLAWNGYRGYVGDASFYASNNGYVIASGNGTVYVMNYQCDILKSYQKGFSDSIVGGMQNLHIMKRRIMTGVGANILSAVSGTRTFTFVADPGFAIGDHFLVTGTPTNNGVYTVEDNSLAPAYIVREAFPANHGAVGQGDGLVFTYELRDLDATVIYKIENVNKDYIFSTRNNPMTLWFADKTNGQFGIMDSLMRVASIGPATYHLEHVHSIGEMTITVEEEIEGTVPLVGTLNILGNSYPYIGRAVNTFTLLAPLPAAYDEGIAVTSSQDLTISGIREAPNGDLYVVNSRMPMQPYFHIYSSDLTYVNDLQADPADVSIYDFDFDDTGGIWYAGPNGVARYKLRFGQYEDPATGGINAGIPALVVAGGSYRMFGDCSNSRYLSNYKMAEKICAISTGGTWPSTGSGNCPACRILVLGKENCESWGVEYPWTVSHIAKAENRIVCAIWRSKSMDLAIFNGKMGFMKSVIVEPTRTFDIKQMSVSSSGNVAIVATDGVQLKLIVYSIVSDSVLASVELDGFDPTDVIRVGVNSIGSIYIFDETYSELRKYTPGGAMVWTKAFSAPAPYVIGGEPRDIHLILTPFDDVYLVGSYVDNYIPGPPDTVDLRIFSTHYRANGDFVASSTIQMATLRANTAGSLQTVRTSGIAFLDLYMNVYYAAVVWKGNPLITDPTAVVTVVNGHGIDSSVHLLPTAEITGISGAVDLDNRPAVRTIGTDINSFVKLFQGELAPGPMGNFGIIVGRFTLDLVYKDDWQASDAIYLRGRKNERDISKRR